VDLGPKKIRVLVVDDSALVRSMLAQIINQQVDMTCVGAAHDPLMAREMIRTLDPDVITLDIEMPHMDGIDFLERLMRLRPMPVLMVSTLTERGAQETLRALALGAVDFVAKPRLGLADGLNSLAGQIVEKIRVAAAAHVKRTAPSPLHAPVMALPGPLGRVRAGQLICIGASTGGTEAIREILMHLPADTPGVVVTLHMPAGFTASFAARLDGVCQMTVKEAVDGEVILPGHAYIAPGGQQFQVGRVGANYVAQVADGAPVNLHKPSVAVLFDSVARVVQKNAIGVMLTGMGSDGAQAMRTMRDAGSYNLVQDAASCVVFGMPREAIARGAADAVLPLHQIAPALVARLQGRTASAAP
jgi:two-component system chemotaxis response regulator CheB